MMTTKDWEQYVQMMNFVKNRIIQLNNDKEKLLLKGGIDTNAIDDQLKFNKKLLMNLDKGEEQYRLEN